MLILESDTVKATSLLHSALQLACWLVVLPELKVLEHLPQRQLGYTTHPILLLHAVIAISSWLELYSLLNDLLLRG